jgi:hypothetical protein
LREQEFLPDLDKLAEIEWGQNGGRVESAVLNMANPEITSWVSELAEAGKVSKTRIGLAICVVLILVLTISNVWLYSTVDGLQKQASTLKTSSSKPCRDTFKIANVFFPTVD